MSITVYTVSPGATQAQESNVTPKGKTLIAHVQNNYITENI